MPLLDRFLLAIAIAASAGHATSQPAPSAAVRLVVGFPAGGPPDLTARLIASRLERQLGRPVVVENQVGASGTVAAASVARAKPDGQTLLFGVAANLAVAPATMRSPPYDPTADFTPIAEVAKGPYVWLVRADAPAKDMAGFIEWARANPGKLNYGTPGQGTLHHLATEVLKQNTGVFIVHVPYRGAAYAGLIGGDIHGMFDTMPAPLPLIESGKLRALGVTGNRRLPALPQVPTLAEQGIPNMEVNAWWGVVGPAGMARATVLQLHGGIQETLADPEVRATFARWGVEPSRGSPEDFGNYIANESRRWRATVASGALRFD
jgi:tripartite-type tricarboxylate transporter receptor subunit TctC